MTLAPPTPAQMVAVLPVTNKFYINLASQLIHVPGASGQVSTQLQAVSHELGDLGKFAEFSESYFAKGVHLRGKPLR